MQHGDRAELAAFLRRRRARMQPSEVGLERGRRRTPGLRRQEVANLAGMSVDYYVRLEQGRGPRPSRQMLAALGRALRLTDDERSHLHYLAGEVPAPPPAPVREVRPGLLHLLTARRLWAEGDVRLRRSTRKLIRHPVAGLLDLQCEALHDPARDQWTVFYTAAPGSPTSDALRALRGANL
ncbi:helix-turn-helix domain-containing protein [Actinomadura sp. NPDC048032]|uniref:MmyB family transcriptional regulator n=1 Tax=Actinomadura sp. NPDC048032 TaxID=3155747 RepID=UPI0033E25E27